MATERPALDASHLQRASQRNKRANLGKTDCPKSDLSKFSRWPLNGKTDVFSLRRPGRVCGQLRGGQSGAGAFPHGNMDDRSRRFFAMKTILFEHCEHSQISGRICPFGLWWFFLGFRGGKWSRKGTDRSVVPRDAYDESRAPLHEKPRKVAAGNASGWSFLTVSNAEGWCCVWEGSGGVGAVVN